jgi:hypothetical protein
VVENNSELSPDLKIGSGFLKSGKQILWDIYKGFGGECQIEIFLGGVYFGYKRKGPGFQPGPFLVSIF